MHTPSLIGQFRPYRYHAVSGIVTLIMLLNSPAPPPNPSDCSFVLGFETFHSSAPDIVGDCLENEYHDAVRGNAYQHTTNGLLMWRKLHNWIAFFDSNGVWTRHKDGHLIHSVHTDHMRLHDSVMLEAKRKELLRFVWGDHRVPWDEHPGDIQQNIVDPLFEDAGISDPADILTTHMPQGLLATAYLFLPRHFNSTLIIYHTGHIGHFWHDRHIIGWLLQRGFPVLALSMPLFPPNNSPTVRLPDGSDVDLNSHGDFSVLHANGLPVMLYFLEPIMKSLNYALDAYSFSDAVMLGYSGGGWTSVLYPAIDDRIRLSYSVAGSLPRYLRTPADRGDFEQKVRPLYDIANYLDLYLMASYGEGRRHVQVQIEFDWCCFAGRAAKSYEDALQDRLEVVGPGSFEVVIDSNPDHTISAPVLDMFLADIGHGRPNSDNK